MNIAREDITAAKPPSQTSRYQPGYDCPLPNDALSELLGKRLPQRAQILGKPPQPPKKRSWLDCARSRWHPAIGWLLGMIGVVALVAVSWPSPEKRARALQESADRSRETEAKAAEALKALRTPNTPAPESVQPAPSSTPAVLEPEVRRAGPVTVKRAEQVFRLGIWSPVWMPDGKLTWVRFLGVKDTFADLPATPQIGDAWGVWEGGQHALWVWHTLPGYTQPAWVDP